MKKLLLLLGVGLLFQACSSDSPVIDDPATDPEATLYDVTFNLKDFEVTTRSTSTEPVGKYLDYAVYLLNAPNKSVAFAVKRGSFTPSDFTGKLSFKLPKGNYRFRASASDKPILSGSYGTATDLTQDIFEGSTDFSVEESNVSQNFKMEHAVGKINLALDDLDKIPSNVQSLTPVLHIADYYNSMGWNEPVSDSIIKDKAFHPVATFGNDGRTEFLIGYCSDDVHIARPDEPIFDPYSKIAISRSELANYNKTNPFTFYFPNNQNYRFLDGFGLSGQTHNLYLIGFDEDVRLNRKAKIVYRKLIKRNIQIIANQSLTITGSILEKGLNLSINDKWDTTIEQEF